MYQDRVAILSNLEVRVLTGLFFLFYLLFGFQSEETRSPKLIRRAREWIWALDWDPEARWNSPPVVPTAGEPSPCGSWSPTSGRCDLRAKAKLV